MSRPPNISPKQKNKKNNNNTLSTHSNATNDLENVIENMDYDSNNWTKVQSLKDGKRNHSSSSEQNSPRTPVNKNKKFFFTANRYEILSQNDHETMLPTIDTTNTNIKKPEASLNVEPKIALPPPIFLRLLHVTFTDLCTKLIEIIGVDNFHCKALADRLKIMTTNPDSYRTLVRS